MLLLHLIQVTESISGSVVPLAMFLRCALKVGPQSLRSPSDQPDADVQWAGSHVKAIPPPYNLCGWNSMTWNSVTLLECMCALSIRSARLWCPVREQSHRLSVGRWRPTSVHLKKEFHSTRRNFTEETNFLCSNFSILIFLNHKFTAQKKKKISTPFWPQYMVQGECLRKSSPRCL